MEHAEPYYYIVVASHDHVRSAIAGGFIQANHGKQSAMNRLQAGDWIICYSGKETYGEETACQQFTAIGEVLPGAIHAGDMHIRGEVAYRRDVNYHKHTNVSIRPLLDRLAFIPNPKHWGFPFRRGFFKIGVDDYTLLRHQLLPDE